MRVGGNAARHVFSGESKTAFRLTFCFWMALRAWLIREMRTGFVILRTPQVCKSKCLTPCALHRKAAKCASFYGKIRARKPSIRRMLTAFLHLEDGLSRRDSRQTASRFTANRTTSPCRQDSHGPQMQCPHVILAMSVFCFPIYRRGFQFDVLPCIHAVKTT